MGLVAIHPQEFVCFCCLKYIFRYLHYAAAHIQVNLTFVKISFLKLRFELKIDDLRLLIQTHLNGHLSLLSTWSTPWSITHYDIKCIL